MPDEVQQGGEVSSEVHSGIFSDSPVSDILKCSGSKVISVIGHHMSHNHASQSVPKQMSSFLFSLFFLFCSSLLLPEQMARQILIQ